MTDPLVDVLLTRLPFERRFDVPGGFASIYAAERWLTERGFCYGPTQVDAPVAIFHGDGLVSKWRNLSREERLAVDGLILRGRNSYREDVVVRLARDPDPTRLPTPTPELPSRSSGAGDGSQVGPDHAVGPWTDGDADAAGVSAKDVEDMKK